MARDIDPSGAANPVAVNDPQQAMIDRTPSTVPTMPTPSPTTAPGGLRGYARLDEALRVAPGEPKSPARDNWVLNLPEDPADVEYTQFLRQAKGAAKARLDGAATKPTDTGPMAPDMGSESAKIWRSRLRNWGIDIAEPPPPGTLASGELGKIDKSKWPVPSGANTAHQQDRVQKELDLRDPGEQQRKYRDKTGDKPIIMGLQVSDQAALVGETDPNNPSGTPDGYVSNWAHKQGLALDNEHAQRAARNGNWVYQGEVADAAGGPGYTRSVYVYVDDAESQLAGMPQATIKAYQKKLGKPQNGVIDPELQAIWHSAVEMARNYARSGVKVTLDFLFQQQLAAKVAAGGSGGGGGAGRFAGESGAEIVGSDYYQAMMQVLGDISGVKG